jgi:hypothetical protein
MKSYDSNSVRPRGQTPNLILASVLSYLRAFVGGDRFENLYNIIRSVTVSLEIKNLRLLDYGCGTMSFSHRLQAEGVASTFIGMDIYPKPVDLRCDPIYSHYEQISEDGIEDKFGKFDLAIAIDVLHHAAEEDYEKILRALAKTSRYVLIKDHFEYGPISRNLLRVADWYGNYAYGVNIPKRYFNRERWRTLVKSAGLTEIVVKTNVKVHGGLFGLIIRPRHHFISVLQE